MREFKVDNMEGRLDKAIVKHYTDLSRTSLDKYFEQNLITVNGKTVKPSYQIKDNDWVMIKDLDVVESDIAKEDIKLNIIYEDKDVIIVNKPSGMVVHPAFGHHSGTLVNALMNYTANLSSINGIVRPGIVHRIDKDTSGLLIVCKNDLTHRNIAKQLQEKTSVRKYIAIVHGAISHNLGRIDAPIGRHPTYRQKMAVVPEGKNAITNFKVLERFKDFTVVELQLETGRTHQIRVHMAYINHPVLGDPLYGPSKYVGNFGQYLHAQTIGFVHPTTNQYVEFTSELPQEFLDKLTELRNSNK